MQLKQIFVSSIWYGIIPKLTLLLNVLLLPLMTPLLTTYDYGVYGILNSYAGVLSIVVVLGLNIHLTNSFYTYKNNFRKVWGRILFLMLISGVVFSLIFGIILTFVLTEVSGVKKIFTIFLTCIPIALISNITLAQHYYPLVYKPKPIVIINLISSFFGISITFVSIYFFKIGFIGWLAGAASTSILMFIFYVFFLWGNEKIKPIFSFNLKRTKRWLRISLPIIPHTFGFLLLSSSDRIIMSFLNVNISDIGLYSNAYQMGDYAIVFIAAMIVAVAPRIQELYRASKFSDLKQLFILCQTVTAFIIVCIAIWMPQIYKCLIHNDELFKANSMAIFICFANIAFPFYSFMSVALFINEETTKILWFVLVPGILNIVLNVILIPIYGFEIAVFTTIMAYWSQFLIPCFVKYFRKNVNQVMGSNFIPIILLIGSTFLLYISYICSRFELIPKICFTICISSLFCLFLLKQLKRSY